MATNYDFDAIAAELLRALRGRRSQRGFARHLGYQSNPVHNWELQRAFPTAAQGLWIAERSGADVKGALRSLFRKAPGWTATPKATTREGVAQFLRHLQGNTSYKELAAITGKNRFKLARWIKGESEPRLPDFLLLLESMSLHLLDFLAALVDPTKLPSIERQWRELKEARSATYSQPWSQAVLRVLETQRYADLPEHDGGVVARWLGIDEEQVTQALATLQLTRQTRRNGSKYIPASDSPTIDTRSDPVAALALRRFWSGVAQERLGADGEALFSHNVFGVSEGDLLRIRELQKAYYQQVRSIVASSEPVERVALLTMHLLPLA